MVSVTGMTGNKRLLKHAQTTIDSAEKLYKQTQRKIKLYHSFSYQAGSWSFSRRVVVKVEKSKQGLNVRYISTDMNQAKAKSLYEDIYCGRGKMELMIKDHKTYTKSKKEKQSMSKKRRNHSSAFKAKVALEAIQGEKTLSELSSHFGLHSSHIQHWKKQLSEGANDVFGGSERDRKDYESEINKLHAKIGQLTMERDFLAKAFGR